MKNDSVKSKKWPLWMRFGLLAGFSGLIFFIFGLMYGMIGLFSGNPFVFLFILPALIAINFSLQGSEMMGVLLAIGLSFVQYFIIGVLVTFIIQKVRNRKA